MGVCHTIVCRVDNYLRKNIHTYYNILTYLNMYCVIKITNRKYIYIFLTKKYLVSHSVNFSVFLCIEIKYFKFDFMHKNLISI